jgi:Tol biopolymer transport system component
MNADGTGVVQLTTGGGYDPEWSPDLNTIVFSGDRDGNQDIYVIGVDGRDERRLTRNPAIDRQPFWSPDASKILFESFRNLTRGASEVYVMDLDGSDPTKLTSFND